MDSSPSLPTRVTLLARLRLAQTDQAAWNEFFELYAPLILAWCRRWKLQPADAEDVTQDVLFKLHKAIRCLDYDPGRGRFRAWLHRVAENAWKDFVANRQRPAVAAGGSEMLDILQNVEARVDLQKELEAAFDRELLDEASARVRLRVQPHTWEAFRLLTEEGLSPREVATKLNMKEAMVYVAKSKVQKMLREEIGKLQEEVDGSCP